MPNDLRFPNESLETNEYDYINLELWYKYRLVSIEQFSFKNFQELVNNIYLWNI
jgi:hypothetical protein